MPLQSHIMSVRSVCKVFVSITVNHLDVIFQFIVTLSKLHFEAYYKDIALDDANVRNIIHILVYHDSEMCTQCLSAITVADLILRIISY